MSYSNSSSSSSSSSQDGNGGNDGAGPSSSSISRRGYFEGPSSSSSASRTRLDVLMNEVLPEPFLEALAAQVAIDASLSIGRLAAAPALANVFQVCSTWRAVSRSDLLWHRLTRRIWRRTHLLRDTWNDEYIYWHRTAINFRTRRSTYTNLRFDSYGVDNDPDTLVCRCLTLSDLHLACGFADGTVRLFSLDTHLHVNTFQTYHFTQLGRFSRAVSGIVMTNSRLVFGTVDGDIYVAMLNGPPAHPRRACTGDVVTNGALVDFTGCGRWWVGLFAGVPGRTFHIWDAHTEECIFVGGTLTDPEAIMGWHMLTGLTEFLGRVRVLSRESAVACTSLRFIAFDLRNQGLVLREEESRRGLIVTSLDVSSEAYILTDARGVATVRRVGTFEEICRFTLRGASQRRVIGCINLGYTLMCAGGVISVWEVEHGEYLYSLRERIDEVNAMVTNDRHVAISCSDTTIHLWDFGAQ
ncbi:Transcriptional regulator STERILE APETALA [Quillaja saponaria]|uniref:Transcriptional regulator STERILE APETALA n=1 Tax=Quillaja saponaria TaxID=32244 RepID=A0AAD7PLJ8_QUISA|nr:Transcriptional regulator STERILE APETALA [Quillaja saponaria]